jgi:hypothetical protein
MSFPLATIPFGKIVGEVFENDLYIHFKYTKKDFKLSDYKGMLNIWADVLLGLKDTDVKIIYSCVPKEEIKTNKFQVMFGLQPYKETDQITIYRMEL